ncbi:homogentisate-dioxygenase [Naviculisporaceae sp. PSN 640]
MPVTDFDVKEKYRYLNGFDCYHESEAVPNALPIGQNSPQKPPLGLYAEKLSGTAFTAPRHENKQTWLYRILPSCSHPPFAAVSNTETSTNGTNGNGTVAKLDDTSTTPAKLHYIPNQLRWDPFQLTTSAEKKIDFVQGLKLISGAGDPTLKQGLGIYIYTANVSMSETEAFYSADGDLLIVAQEGALDIRTEFGWLLVRPMEIAVIPRGVKYQVHLVDSTSPVRGYALELYQGHFQLPELGPIGSNGLANARDFQAPVACFSEDFGSTGFEGRTKYTVTVKFNNSLFQTTQPHTPFDVVAWHGNYYPYKYDLGRFNTIGSISFDHPDPSIFTVLSAPSDHAGTAIADFVIFPPRWLVGEDTFRPPWYHRNTMSEFMGLIKGDYDAKKAGKGGFVPGGASLHNVMSGHGPDAGSYEGAREAELKPVKVGGGSCAFMFESCLMLGVTGWGLKDCEVVQAGYSEHSWGGVNVYWTGRKDGKTDGERKGHLVE